MRGSRAAGGAGGAADLRAGGSRSQMPAITEEATRPPASASRATSSENQAASVGQRERAGGGAQLHRRLAQPKREPALAAREPRRTRHGRFRRSRPPRTGPAVKTPTSSAP